MGGAGAHGACGIISDCIIRVSGIQLQRVFCRILYFCFSSDLFDSVCEKRISQLDVGNG